MSFILIQSVEIINSFFNMKTKDPTTPNGSDQDRTISGSITKSRRRSITIRFPKAYITEYRKRKMLERMSTTTPTSQNALDVSYAGQDQGKLDEGNKSERTSIIIKFPKAYIHKLQQDTVVEHAAHEDKSQSAGIQSKKSASPHGSNALGLDNTAKASATEIERHEDALAGPDMKAISATFSTAQERQNLAKTPPRIRLIFHKDKKAKTAWAKLHNKKDALVQKSTIAADALAQQPFEAPVKAEAEETQQEKAQLHNKEDAVVQKSNVAKRSEEPVKTEAEQRHQEKMKKIDAMMIPADPESKARLEEI